MARRSVAAATAFAAGSLGFVVAVVLAVVVAVTPVQAGTVPPETVPETVPVPTLADPPVDAGAVEIITPQGEPLESGGSSTLYSLKLPEGASCPGDTASGNWLVQSFLIPVGDDPGAIEYGVAGPEGTQFPLFAFDTKPFAHQPTRVSSSPDDPGVIPLLPGLTFAVFEPGYIPAGTYRIGVACTFFRQTFHYWDTEIVIEADASDEPAQLTWRVPNAPPYEPPSDGSTRRRLIMAGIAVALAAAAVLLWQSRRETGSPTPPRRDRDPQHPLSDPLSDPLSKDSR